MRAQQTHTPHEHGEVAAISPLEELRFGCRTAKALSITSATLPAVIDFCQRNAVELLIARCSHQDIAAAQAMETSGFRLMDSLVYFTRNLVKVSIPTDTGRIPVRPMRSGEEAAVARVAGDAFHNYLSHFHADSRLNPADCDAVYSSWAEALACARGETSEMFVATTGPTPTGPTPTEPTNAETVVGFAGVRLNNPRDGEGVLFGIAPAAQGFGIYPSFMVAAMNWCRDKGATRMVISTQANNVQVQRVWARFGFEPHSGYYTFHKWFNLVEHNGVEHNGRQHDVSASGSSGA